MTFRIVSAIALAAVFIAASSQARDIYYTVQTAAPVSEQTIITGAVLWRCTGTTCVAAKNGRRAASICSKLQREVGDIASFTAGNETLDAAALAKCNTA